MSGVKSYLKVTVLFFIFYAAAGCSKNLKVASSHRPDPKSTSVVSAPGHQKKARVSVTGNAEPGRGVGKICPPNRVDARGSKQTRQILEEALEFCRTSQDFWGQGDFENAIASLDQAYNLILITDTNEKPKLIQEKEDIRFMICKRMLEIYSSRYVVATGNHDAIPMVKNRYVEKEIGSFKGVERGFFLRSYKRSGRYRPEILKALKEAGLPKELSWLPLIESGFKVKALSSARALGLWQFIPSTGYKFGLKRTQWVDERMDVTKSTQAAIAYLKELHNMFGDWTTVLAAYNCGEGRVLRVIRNQNVQYLDNFWDLYEKLPCETARYVPRFLAALSIVNDPEKYGFDLNGLDPPRSYEMVTVSKQMLLKDVAKNMSISNKILEDLNPDLRRNVTPHDSYELKVPKGKGAFLVARLDKIPVWTPPKRLYAYHRVRPGETLSRLAARYRTSVRAIAATNHIKRQDHITVGQRLKIPSSGKKPVYAKAKKTAGSWQSGPVSHRVRRGDSLWLLARQYNTNTKEIIRLNSLKNTRLFVGQKLIISRGTEAVQTAVDTKTYRVKRGDTPYKIACSHKMKLERFLRINELTPRSKIYPGQALDVEAR